MTEMKIKVEIVEQIPVYSECLRLAKEIIKEESKALDEGKAVKISFASSESARAFYMHIHKRMSFLGLKQICKRDSAVYFSKKEKD